MNFIFKNSLLFFLSGLYSITINIPDDYPTIQEGIDVAAIGDTVLVADGDYQENLVISKSIVLASHAIFDDLDDWVAYDDVFYEQWVINNSHIANTRIIGNNPSDADYASVILITPNSDTCISPEIIGFTIKYGTGTVVYRSVDDSPDSERYSVRLGGGILADVSDPIINYNFFKQNGTPPNGAPTTSGGAIQITSSSEDWSFNDRFIDANPRCEVEEFQISNNLYDDNDAQIGNSLANKFHELEFDMSGSIFDVRACSADGENQVSPAWVKVERTATIDYSDIEGNGCAITASNVYVDSNIDEECFDEDCGTPNNPFKTITRTMELILPTESNPITIHLTEGTYSPETGEIFPIIILGYVTIEGLDEETTILDAMEYSGVIIIESSDSIYINNLTIQNGRVETGVLYEGSGGGLYIDNSNVVINNCIIKNNTSSFNGGGISITGSSIINIYNSIIKENNAGIPVEYNDGTTQTRGMGGGIYMDHYLSEPNYLTIENSEITNNYCRGSENNGGGGIFSNADTLIFNNVNITNNVSDDTGGGIEITGYDTYNEFNNIVISNNESASWGGGIDCRASINFSSVSIVNNSSGIGGGLNYIYGIDDYGSFYGCDISFNENEPSSIYSNNAMVGRDLSSGWFGLGMGFSEGEGALDNTPVIHYLALDTFSVSAPNSLFASPVENFQIDNDYHVIDQILTDIYVSNDGDDLNVGDSYEAPLKNLNTAFERSSAYPDNQQTIHLLNGEYNFDLSAFEDTLTFSDQISDLILSIPSYVTIKGESINNTIISSVSNDDATMGNNPGFYFPLFFLWGKATNVNIENITFTDNEAPLFLGFFGIGPITLRNIIIRNNDFYAPYIINAGNTSFNLINVTIAKNQFDLENNLGEEYDGLFILSSGETWMNGDPIASTIINSIIYDNSITNIQTNGLIVLNSDIELGEASFVPMLPDYNPFGNSDSSQTIDLIYENNINTDPLFVNSDMGILALQEDSPCIDVGIADLNNYGLENITDYYGLAPDMGAIEFIDCSSSLGDLNVDGTIDISDIIQMVNIIMGFTSATEDEICRADINQDGIIDIFDVIIIINIILNQ